MRTSRTMLSLKSLKSSEKQDKLKREDSVSSVSLSSGGANSPPSLPREASVRLAQKKNKTLFGSSPLFNKIMSSTTLTSLGSKAGSRDSFGSREHASHEFDSSDNIRICTKLGVKKGKRSRKLMGKFAEPRQDFEDSFGNNIMSLGIAQEIGFKDQDRYDVRVDKYCYASVIDGHGLSDAAADTCMNELYDAIGKPDKGQLPDDQAIINAFHSVDENLRQNKDVEPRTGACVVSVMIQLQDEENMIDDSVFEFGSDSDAGDDVIPAKVAWVGDCRGLLVSENGNVEELTRDHRIGVNDEEKKRVEKSIECSTPRAGLLGDPLWDQTVDEYNKIGVVAKPHSFIGYRTSKNGKQSGSPVIFAHTNGVSLQISRSIGDKHGARSIIPTPEIYHFNVNKNEQSRIVLGSDGLFDSLDATFIAKSVNRMNDPRKAAKYLAAKAKEKMVYGGKSVDDITVVVLDILK